MGSGLRLIYEDHCSIKLSYRTSKTDGLFNTDRTGTVVSNRVNEIHFFSIALISKATLQFSANLTNLTIFSQLNHSANFLNTSSINGSSAFFFTSSSNRCRLVRGDVESHHNLKPSVPTIPIPDATIARMVRV